MSVDLHTANNSHAFRCLDICVQNCPFLSLSLSLSLYFSLFLSSGNVPHAYADNIQINMGDRRNETLLIISRVRLPRESDKCIILIGLLYMSFTIIK